MAEQPEIDIALDYTVNIVSHYVKANPVPVTQLPDLIVAVHAMLVRLSTGAPAETERQVEAPTAAAIRKSVTHEALISFIDGKRYKTLKRHLGKHGLTPEDYRARFSLPADYPMTSPAYSAKRGALAREFGLGKAPRATATLN